MQSDDKSALFEISRQLKLENVINDKVFGSFSDSFDFLLRSFRTGDKQSKPLIFIMEEFDLFTKNKSQLLLYTILNTIQTSSSPMCLIGTTCRIDVLDLLEKRIKSRFSHRQIYLFNDYTFERYIEMGKYFMESNIILDKSQNDANAKVSKHLKPYLDVLFEDKSILKLFNSLFEYDKSISTLKRLLIFPSVKLEDFDEQTLKSKNITFLRDEFIRAFNLLNMDTKYSLLSGLSVLELTLIVVMLEMTETYIDEPFNFDLIYSAYLKYLLKRNWGQQKHERQIILKVSF